MKKPSPSSNPLNEHMELVTHVVEKLRKRKFGFMEESDIGQEAYIICMEVIPKWDGIRSLENFLMLSVSNRLISLARTYNRNEKLRKSIDFMELHDKAVEQKDEVGENEEVEIIISQLSVAMRSDFYRVAQGVRIPPTRRNALFAKIREISNEER